MGAHRPMLARVRGHVGRVPPLQRAESDPISIAAVHESVSGTKRSLHSAPIMSGD